MTTTTAITGTAPATTSRLRWSVLTGVAVLAVVQIALPFTGDQALFTTVGRQLAEGDRLYLDVWDVKQPLLFWWYAAAGWVGGSSEVGVHLVEAVWLVGFAAVLPRLLRGEVSARAAALAPALTVGAFLLAAEPIDLTQAEALGGPLVFLAVWVAATGAGRVTARRLVVAGVLVGVCAALKLTLAPLAAAGLVVVVLTADRDDRWRTAFRAVGWATLGFAVVVAAVGAHLSATGALGEALDTWFRFAPTTTDTAPPPVSRLVRSAVRFVVMYAPVALLAVLGAGRLRRRRWTGGPPRVLLAMALWVVLTLPMVLVQHWWPYLFQIAIVPLGVLAASGTDVAAGWARGEPASRRALAAGALALALALVVALVAAAPKWASLAEHRVGITAADRRELREDLYAAYGRAAAFDEATRGRPGDLVVLGDPVVHQVTGRRLGVPTNGWSPEQLDAAHWARLGDELVEREPAFLVIDEPSRALLDERAPDVAAVIADGWCEIGGVDGDRWYASRGSGAC